MSTIIFSAVPSFLYENEFCQSLDSDGGISAPEDQNFTFNDVVRSAHDLRHILHVIKFWGVDRIHVGVIEYCYCTDAFVWESAIVQVQDDQSAFRPVVCFQMCQSGISLIERAIYAGRIEILVYLVNMVDPKEDSFQNAIATACAKGRLDFLRVLHKVGFGWGDKALTIAAEGGHLDCLQYIHDHRCPWPEVGCSVLDVCAAAASNGHLGCLKFAHKNGSAWDSRTLLFAARGGHLQCIIYGHEEGLKWPDDLCCEAAKCGHLDCLTYAREHGCVWDSTVTLHAATHGHVDCLQYALERCCPVQPNSCTEAAAGGHLRCLRLLCEHRAPWSVETTTAAAARAGHMHCFVYLHENGCPWDETTTNAAVEFGHVETYRYATVRECPAV